MPARGRNEIVLINEASRAGILVGWRRRTSKPRSRSFLALSGVMAAESFPPPVTTLYCRLCAETAWDGMIVSTAGMVSFYEGRERRVQVRDTIATSYPMTLAVYLQGNDLGQDSFLF